MLVAPSVNTERPTATEGPRVVLVEKPLLSQAAIARLLRGAPLFAQVVTETRSDAALGLAAGGTADLIIADVMSEPQSGPDLALKLQSTAPRVRLIVLGERGDASNLVRSIRLGAAGAVTRDTSPEEFLSGVQLALAGHRVVSDQLMQMVLSGSLWRRTRTEHLTQAEMEVLAMLGEGLTVADIATRRGSSQKTIRNHLARIYHKLQLRGRTDAMIYAMRAGVSAQSAPQNLA